MRVRNNTTVEGGKPMRRILIAFALSLCVSAGAAAQIHPATSSLVNSSPSLAPPIAGITSYDPATEDLPQFQAYIGYAWTRFTGIPNNPLEMNGFTADFTGYYKWIGIEGELSGELSSFAGETAKQSFLGIGPHFRLGESSRLQPWAHALVGRAHFFPVGIEGGQGGFGWQVGGGVDYRFTHLLSFRAGVDALGSIIASKSTIGPKVHAGVVFNF
jgi:opacity protein-like surface antigen